MSEDDNTFEATLQELEQVRERGEASYFAQLQQLRERLARLHEAARAAEAAAREARQGATPARERDAFDNPLVAPLAVVPAHQPAGIPWPRAGGLRGVINRVVRWAMRDFLETLDRRQEAVAEAIGKEATEIERAMRNLGERFEPVVQALRHLAARQDADAAETAELRSALGRQHTLTEATRAVAGRVAEVVDLMEGNAEQLRLLADVKDAETLQRAVGGPLRRMDVLFDEVQRQQEALLSELVGRRAELDALIAQLVSSARD